MARRLSRPAGRLAILDFFVTIGCYVGVVFLWQRDSAPTYLLYENGLSAAVVAAGALLILLYFQGVYSARHRHVGVGLALSLMTPLGVAFLLEAAVFYVKKSLALPVSVMAPGSAAALALLLITRVGYYGMRTGGRGGDRVLLVGATSVNRRIARRIHASPEMGFTVVGFLDDVLPPGTMLDGGEALGPLSALPEVRRSLAPHRIVADIRPEDLRLNLLEGAGGPGSLERPEALYEFLFARVCRLQPTDLLFESKLAPSGFRMVVQAVYSDLVALAGIIVFAPAILLIAALIRISSGGPVFERQLTTGWNLRPFTRLRFRCWRIVKTDAGQRRELTKLGGWLKRFRLQGLPQLWNVLRGEMTLVGPPPLREEFASALIEALPHYRLAYALQPGLASWSRVNEETNVLTALEYDLYYIKYMSPSLALSILLRAYSQAA